MPNDNPDWDNGEPNMNDKVPCECGRGMRQYRSKMCLQCWREVQSNHPRWKGSEAWHRESSS